MSRVAITLLWERTERGEDDDGSGLTKIPANAETTFYPLSGVLPGTTCNMRALRLADPCYRRTPSERTAW